METPAIVSNDACLEKLRMTIFPMEHQTWRN